MHLMHTNNYKNLDKRMFNVAEYKARVEVNENTPPFPIKLLVLDTDTLSATLYEARRGETDISRVKPP